jgi:hypothetical protein
MSPNDTIARFLDDVPCPGETAGPARPAGEFPVPEGVLHLELTARDQLACSFRCLSLRSSRLSGASTRQLRDVCDRLAGRLHYLLEPLRLVEVDDNSAVAQMRSDRPRLEGAGSSYYELLVRRGGEISLRRYHSASGQRRQPVPATVTREVLGRLCDDLVAALSD